MTSINQFEKNVQTSFGYVKKDLLMVNDAISDVHEKIQHLSMNHASLLAEISRLSERLKKIETKKTVKTTKKAKAKKTSKKPIKKVVKETVTYS